MTAAVRLRLRPHGDQPTITPGRQGCLFAHSAG